MKFVGFLLIFLFIFGKAFSAELDSESNRKLNEASSDLEAYIYAKKYNKALEACAVIYKIDDVTGALEYAETYRLMENYQESIKWGKLALERADKKRIDTEVYLLVLGSSYHLAGENKNAEEMLDRAIRTYPDSPNGYKAYAQYYEKVGDNKNALRYWQEAMKRFTDEEAVLQAKEHIGNLESKLQEQKQN